MDVIVATPSSLLKYRQQERILLSDISHLVLDEADTLLDESFVEATTSIVRAIKLRTKKPPKFPAKAEGAQVTVVGATLTDHVINMVDKLVPVRFAFYVCAFVTMVRLFRMSRRSPVSICTKYCRTWSRDL